MRIYRLFKHWVLLLLSLMLYALLMAYIALNWDRLFANGVVMQTADRMRPLLDVQRLDAAFQTRLMTSFSLVGVLALLAYGFYWYLPWLHLSWEQTQKLSRSYRRSAICGLLTLCVFLYTRLFAIAPAAGEAARALGAGIFGAAQAIPVAVMLLSAMAFERRLMKNRVSAGKRIGAGIGMALLLLFCIGVPVFLTLMDGLQSPVGNASAGLFRLMDGFDLGLSLIPFLGVCGLWVNFKYNAPLGVGVPVTEKGAVIKAAYTLVSHREIGG